MIKTVLIDIDNTLLDFDKCAEYAIRSAFYEKNIAFTDNVMNTFFEINTALWKDIENGKLDKNGLYKIRWNKIFDSLSIKHNGAEFERTFLKYLSQSHEKVDGAEELLQYLSKKYVLCAASNGPQGEQTSRLLCAGLLDYFDYVFTSEYIGFQKPRKEFFISCIEKSGSINPQEIIMIGDSTSADIEGAKDVGIVTCFFDYKKVEIKPPKADYCVSRLKEIIDII